MTDFQNGDTVSFIHDRLSGTVRQILNKHQVMVELDDGFCIPVNTHELVLTKAAYKDEAENASEQKIQNYHPAKNTEEKICMAFTAEENTRTGQAKISVHLINETPQKLMYCVFASGQKSWRPIANGEADKFSAISITNFPIGETEHWRQWHVQILRFPVASLLQTQISIYAPLEKSFKLKPASLLNNKQTVPILNINGFVEDILVKNETETPEAENNIEIKSEKEPEKNIEPFSEVVDLHINASEENNMVEAQLILQQQLAQVEKSIDNALAALMPRLIFIHGVGNGTLKMEIQKILMRHKNVSRWEEADTKKYGYGATAVYFKYR